VEEKKRKENGGERFRQSFCRRSCELSSALAFSRKKLRIYLEDLSLASHSPQDTLDPESHREVVLPAALIRPQVPSLGLLIISYNREKRDFGS
jgi:hypothetical protein